MGVNVRLMKKSSYDDKGHMLLTRDTEVFV